MKTKELQTIEDPRLTPGMAEADIILPFQTRPMIVRGVAETVIEAVRRLPAAQTADVPAETEKPVQKAPEASREAYMNLGELDDRTAARLALKCWLRDVRNFGQTHKYREFRQRRWEEQNASFDMSVGLIQAVHCRLHEHVLARATGKE